ncbi:MAG TPA: hypothetical protein VIY48_10030, partial [Candidatus Paceibacterota bacterium]
MDDCLYLVSWLLVIRASDLFRASIFVLRASLHGAYFSSGILAATAPHSSPIASRIVLTAPSN